GSSIELELLPPHAVKVSEVDGLRLLTELFPLLIYFLSGIGAPSKQYLDSLIVVLDRLIRQPLGCGHHRFFLTMRSLKLSQESEPVNVNTRLKGLYHCGLTGEF